MLPSTRLAQQAIRPVQTNPAPSGDFPSTTTPPIDIQYFSNPGLNQGNADLLGIEQGETIQSIVPTQTISEHSGVIRNFSDGAVPGDVNPEFRISVTKVPLRFQVPFFFVIGLVRVELQLAPLPPIES